MAHRRLFSAIIYNSLYFVLYIILLGLLLITPGDAIERSLRNKQIYNIWILSAAYVLVVLVVAFVYFTRLYINKTDLAAIPKGWVPIEKGDVRSAVYEMIAAGLSRSAEVAFDARPRLQVCEEDREYGEQAGAPGPSLHQTRSPEAVAAVATTTAPPRRAVWGEIEHFGWASPNSPDLPNLQYCTVLSELPNLIEAKAVTLAPPDPTSQSDPPMLDGDAVALLQRAPNMDLREYINHLASIGVLDADSAPATTSFLSQYEYARFSTRPISNARFKQLMHVFADVLRAMQPLNADFLYAEDAGDARSFESSYMDDDASQDISPTMSRQHLSPTDTSSTHSSMRPSNVRNSSASTWHMYRTPPNSLRSRITGAGPTISRKSSVNSFAQSRHPYAASNQSSSASLRSGVSGMSSSGGSSRSVIRLATRHDSTELPYVLSLKDTLDG